MSIEAQIQIMASFPDKEKAKSATSALRKSLKATGHELASALDQVHPVKNQSNYIDVMINVENISRQKNQLSMYAYSYSSEEPIWFTQSLYKLGASRIHIACSRDGHRRNYYFLNGEPVTKKRFVGETPNKPLTEKDIEINKSLFLPEGRVHVKAKLINHQNVGDIYESVLLEFETDDGNRFYHKATGRLKEMSFEGHPNECEFTAAFERGMLGGEYVSYAKRPSKIEISLPDYKDPIDLNLLQGAWKMVEMDGISAKLLELNAYWIFQNGNFTQIWNKEKMGPFKYVSRNDSLSFKGEKIRILKLSDRHMEVEWMWNAKLEKDDDS